MLVLNRLSILGAALGCFLSATTSYVQAQAAIKRELAEFKADELTTKEDNEWLEAKFNDKENVNVLKSGLMYKVLKTGEGEHHPTATTPCDCHYHGTLTSGTVFDSSVDRGTPSTFAPNQVIKAWTEAMQLMVEGDKWEMYIPGSLGYGASGAGTVIPKKAALQFQMELIKIKGDKRSREEL